MVDSDGMASGVYKALEKQQFDMGSPSPYTPPRVVIAGRGGDPAGLNRVARYTQKVDLRENLTLVGKIAGEAALALCANPYIDQVTTSAGKPKPFAVPGGPAISAVPMNPVATWERHLLPVVIRSSLKVKWQTSGGVMPTRWTWRSWTTTSWRVACSRPSRTRVSPVRCSSQAPTPDSGGLNRVALGLQTVDVGTDPNEVPTDRQAVPSTGRFWRRHRLSSPSRRPRQRSGCPS